jgi:hypothetical protein
MVDGMNLANLMTCESIQVALAARQAHRELNAAIVVAEIALLAQAQKNRPERQRRAVFTSMEWS